MRIYLIIISIIIVSTSAFAQETTFSKKIGYSSYIYVNSTASSFENGQLMAGHAEGKGLVVNTDSFGDQIWSYTYSEPEGTIDMHFKEIISCVDSTFFITGYSFCNSESQSAVCAKISDDGSVIWSKEYNANNACMTHISFAQQTNDNGYIVLGQTHSVGSLLSYIFIAKLTSEGNIQWSKQLRIGNNANYGDRVIQTSDGNLILVGYMADYPAYSPFSFLIKLSSSGNILWSKKYEVPANPSSYSGNDIEYDDSCYVCCLRGTIVKVDSIGNVLSCKKASSIENPDEFVKLSRLIKTYDDGYIYLSESNSNCNIIKEDSLENVLWGKNVILNLYDFISTFDNGIILVGGNPSYKNQETIYEDNGIIKIDSIGNGQNCMEQANYFFEEETINVSDMEIEIIDGATMNTFTSSRETIELLFSDGCLEPYTFEDNLVLENCFDIFPNPNDGVFEIKNITDKRLYLIIYDISGQKLLEKSFNYENNTIDCSFLKNGIYYYSIYYSHRIIKSDKFIISK
ncbi:MAG: T9SS type A sorting domain-containing protein [Bacteroidales bacterium]|nr:T9SS type A sorting domain-containing protein [Bacteroidales bacterium]MDD3860380.1 T9SS type A sorting domain-containing protein [Bacteroidales bacterium]